MSDNCPECGHEWGEHAGVCEVGIHSGRPCGCTWTTNAWRYGLPVPHHLNHNEAEMWVEGYLAALAGPQKGGAS